MLFESNKKQELYVAIFIPPKIKNKLSDILQLFNPYLPFHPSALILINYQEFAYNLQSNF